jgi:hypothetical protein
MQSSKQKQAQAKFKANMKKASAIYKKEGGSWKAAVKKAFKK